MNNRKKLITLYKNLNIPFKEKSVKDDIDHLSDREVELLVKAVEELQLYKSVVKELAYKENPKQASQIDQTYDDKLSKIQNEADEISDKMSREADAKLDDIEKEETEEIDALSSTVKRSISTYKDQESQTNNTH